MTVTITTEHLQRPFPLVCADCAATLDLWEFDPAQVAIDEVEGHVLELPGWDWLGAWFADPQDADNPWSFCCSQGCFDRRRPQDYRAGHDLT